MPPVVIGVAAGVAASTFLGVSLLVAGAIALGTAVSVSMLGDALTPDFDVGAVDPVASQAISTQANQPRKIAYGEVILGGQIIGYSKVETPDATYQAIAIHVVSHPCESIEIYEIEGKTLGEIASAVTTEFHTGEQTQASQLALNNIVGWTNAFVGYGLTNAYLLIKDDPELFPNGLNDIKFKVRGKRVYNVRKDTTKGGDGTHREDDESTWEWSQNPIDCTFDYVRFHGNRPIPSRRLPWDFIAYAANYCDEQAAYLDKDDVEQSETRFTLNGTLNKTLKPGQGLKMMLSSFGGKIYRPSGRIYIKPSMYVGPATVTITPDDFYQQPLYQPHRSEQSKCNLVRAEYVAADLNYQVTDAPVIKNDTYIASDGVELEHNLKLMMTDRSTVANRLQRHKLERSRAGFISEAELKGIRLDLVPGSVARFVDPETQIDKEFIVESFRLNTRTNTTRVTFEEDSPDIYPDGFIPAESDLTPNTSLPDTTNIAATADILFTQKLDSWRVGFLSWTHPIPGSVVKYEIQLSDSTGTVRLPKIYTSFTTDIDLPGLDVGPYGVYIKAYNRFGKTSEAFGAFDITSVFELSGAQWYSGSAVPDNSLGQSGDFYRRTGTTELYLKDAQNGWEITGDLGGADGDKWLSGTTNPANSLGTNGDLYLNTTTNDLFQKIGGVWALQTNIKGVDGAPGANGDDGKSAYQIWLDEGNAGSVSDFLDDLNGNDGVDGNEWFYIASGSPSGALGKISDFALSAGRYVYEKVGASTWTYRYDLKGSDGAPGDDGDDGLSAYELWLDAGNTGSISVFLDDLNGNDGIDGNEWFYISSGTPSGSLGKISDFALSAGRYVYEKVGASTWTYRYDLKGSDGAPGDDGEDGLSAYELWLDAGNTGSISAFLNALNGSDGIDGNEWFYVSTGTPSSSLGKVNDFALSGGRYVYQKTSISTWTYRYDLQGPVGPIGPQGPEGTATVIKDTGNVIANTTWKTVCEVTLPAGDYELAMSGILIIESPGTTVGGTIKFTKDGTIEVSDYESGNFETASISSSSSITLSASATYKIEAIVSPNPSDFAGANGFITATTT